MNAAQPMPTLFQIAANWENFGPASTFKTSPVLGQIPFADLMLNPQKLVIALKAAKAEKNALATTVISRALTRKKATGIKRDEPCRAARELPPLRNVEFYLSAPEATSVQLAADFTSWEKFPLDLMQSEDGTWFTFVPLAPGEYAYRFIVDGQWLDDPNAADRVANPFGTANAKKKVE